MSVRMMLAIGAVALLETLAVPSRADPLIFSNGNVDGRMATASRPDVGGSLEIESADDFIISGRTRISSASFTGLLTGVAPVVGEVVVEIYRVFPNDSTVPPSGDVPTRVNSPSDIAFASRATAAGTLTFSTTTISASLTAANSVLNGINGIPNQTSGGEGPVTGSEVEFDVSFATPFDLPADHYFFVPQVQVTGGEFYWLSSTRPIVAPGTPFAPDLQEWVRNETLAPDWLRVGTDIVGGATAPTFNAAFTLNGVTVPEPTSWGLFAVGTLGLLTLRNLRRPPNRV